MIVNYSILVRDWLKQMYNVFLCQQVPMHYISCFPCETKLPEATTKTPKIEMKRGMLLIYQLINEQVWQEIEMWSAGTWASIPSCSGMVPVFFLQSNNTCLALWHGLQQLYMNVWKIIIIYPGWYVVSKIHQSKENLHGVPRFHSTTTAGSPH